MTAKKCTKKRDARAKLLFYQSKPIAFLPFSLTSPYSFAKAPYRGIRNLWKFWLCNPVSCALESGIPLTMEPGIQVTLKKNGIEYLESGIHGVESRTQNPEFPYMVRGGGWWGERTCSIWIQPLCLFCVRLPVNWLTTINKKFIHMSTKHLFS